MAEKTVTPLTPEDILVRIIRDKQFVYTPNWWCPETDKSLDYLMLEKLIQHPDDKAVMNWKYTYVAYPEEKL